ncbi:MAG: hypothetical protein AB1585_16610 [Thermodesulfobacteriota bacterium]
MQCRQCPTCPGVWIGRFDGQSFFQCFGTVPERRFQRGGYDGGYH